MNYQAWSKKFKKQYIFILVCLLFLWFSNSLSFHAIADHSVSYFPPLSSQSNPHNVIQIDGNAGFQITENNFTGTGTEGDPYTFEGFSIVPSMQPGIDFLNTNAYVIIRNCTISGGTSNSALVFQNVSNVIAENCIFTDGNMNIILSSCDNIIFRNCTVVNATNEGILIWQCRNIQILNSQIYFCETGIYLTVYCNNTLISGCDIHDILGYGFDEDSQGYGILIRGSTYTTIRNNTIDNTSNIGIYLWATEHETVTGAWHNKIVMNNISRTNEWGIALGVRSENNSVQLNNFFQNSDHPSQGLDNGTGNHIIGNYWDEWIGPDTDADNIVDNPYPIDGTAGNYDNFSLTFPYPEAVPPEEAFETTEGSDSGITNPYTPNIPDFSTMAIIAGIFVPSIGLFIFLEKSRFWEHFQINRISKITAEPAIIKNIEILRQENLIFKQKTHNRVLKFFIQSIKELEIDLDTQNDKQFWEEIIKGGGNY